MRLRTNRDNGPAVPGLITEHDKKHGKMKITLPKKTLQFVLRQLRAQRTKQDFADLVDFVKFVAHTDTCRAVDYLCYLTLSVNEKK